MDEKKKDSVESQIQKQLRVCKDFLYVGNSLSVAEVIKIHTFKTQKGNYQDGNILYTGQIELYVNILENDKCSKFYEMTGTANQNEDGKVELTTPVYLSASPY